MTNEYELHLVSGTNIFVIVKKQDFSINTMSCSCPVSKTPSRAVVNRFLAVYDMFYLKRHVFLHALNYE